MRQADWEETVRAAEKEGQVNVYIAGYSAIVDSGVFQKAFPKIKVVGATLITLNIGVFDSKFVGWDPCSPIISRTSKGSKGRVLGFFSLRLRIRSVWTLPTETELLMLLLRSRR
jgi:hypothetical protein